LAVAGQEDDFPLSRASDDHRRGGFAEGGFDLPPFGDLEALQAVETRSADDADSIVLRIHSLASATTGSNPPLPAARIVLIPRCSNVTDRAARSSEPVEIRPESHMVTVRQGSSALASPLLLPFAGQKRLKLCIHCW